MSQRRRPLPPALLRRDRDGREAVRRDRCPVRDADRHVPARGGVRRGRGMGGIDLGADAGGPTWASRSPARRWPCTAPRCAAPNGVEMMSALALWTSLIGLLLAASTSRSGGSRCSPGSRVPCWRPLRPLGPLWCLLVLAAVLLAVRAEHGPDPRPPARPAVLGAARPWSWSAHCRAPRGSWLSTRSGSGVEKEIHTSPRAPSRGRSHAAARLGPPDDRGIPAAQRRQPPGRVRVLPDPVRGDRRRSGSGARRPRRASRSASSRRRRSCSPTLSTVQSLGQVPRRLAGPLRAPDRDGHRPARGLCARPVGRATLRGPDADGAVPAVRGWPRRSRPRYTLQLRGAREPAGRHRALGPALTRCSRSSWPGPARR